jgi:hypothetical protein
LPSDKSKHEEIASPHKTEIKNDKIPHTKTTNPRREIDLARHKSDAPILEKAKTKDRMAPQDMESKDNSPSFSENEKSVLECIENYYFERVVNAHALCIAYREQQPQIANSDLRHALTAMSKSLGEEHADNHIKDAKRFLLKAQETCLKLARGTMHEKIKEDLAMDLCCNSTDTENLKEFRSLRKERDGIIKQREQINIVNDVDKYEDNVKELAHNIKNLEVLYHKCMEEVENSNTGISQITYTKKLTKMLLLVKRWLPSS